MGGGGGGSLVVDLNKEVVDLTSKVGQLAKALKQSEDQVALLLQREKSIPRSTPGSSNEEVQRLKEEVQRLKEEVQRLRLASTNEEVLLSDSERDRRQLKALLDSSLDENFSLRKEAREATRRCEEADSQNKVVLAECSSLRERIDRLLADLGDRDKQVVHLSMQLSTASEEVLQERDRRVRTQERLAEISSELGARNEEVRSLSSQLITCRATATTSTSLLVEQHKEEVQRLQKSLAALEEDKQRYH